MSTNYRPLVTAVVTTYKRSPNILLRAISSILSQTYENLEIIIVDDSPSDFILRSEVEKCIISINDKRIKYIKHDTNLGACASRNTALDYAKGEFIAYLDDDDEWISTKICKQLSVFINSSPNTALVYCNAYQTNDDTNTKIVTSFPEHTGYVFDYLILENFIASTSFPLIKTTALKSIGGFDVNLKSSQDFDVWLRLSQKFEVAFTPEPLAIYHTHNNERISNNPQNKIDGLEYILKKYDEYFKYNKKAYLVRQASVAPFYAALKKYKKSFLIWCYTSFRRPFSIKENLYQLYLIFLYATNKV